MKEIEVKVTKYVAEDGTRFDDKESCEKHDAKCRVISDACSNRIAMIRAKRKALDDEENRIKREKERELDRLQEQIRSMKNRIDAIIAVGNEMLTNNLKPSDGDFWVCSSHWVGFFHYSCGGIKRIGVKLFESYLSTHYCTFILSSDGDEIKYSYSASDRYAEEYFNFEVSTDKRISLCERFLEDFGRFESKLYAWIDEKMK